MSSNQYTEKLALRYVQWLAQRDGLTIPSRLKSRCVWSGFTSKYKTRTIGAREWREARTQEAYCRRVQAVEWGREEERYATRKDGLRGAWTHNEWVAEFRIDIPHWDFEHPEPVDEGTP